MSLCYLKSTIKAEPLFWRWYVLSYLILPAAVVYNIVERHLNIMPSHVQNPQIHAQAVKDPKLLGGAFVDCETTRTEETNGLIRTTKKDCDKRIILYQFLKEEIYVV